MSAEGEERAEPRAASEEGETGGSPIRSILAVVGGFVVLWILGGLYVGVLGSLAGDQFPEGGVPTTTGLLLLLVGAVPNGIVAGLIVGRAAGHAPIVHAAVLGGLIGFVGMMSSEQAHGMPWWFALGRIALPILFLVLGGAIARATPPRRTTKKTA